MRISYGMSPAVKASIEAQEMGGTIQATGPYWVPTKWAEVLAERIAYNLRYLYAHQEYLIWHGGNLPGSNRTKRLRKKRRSKIMQWRYGK